MTDNTRQPDPEIPVTVNLRVPWSLKQFVVAKAHAEHKSQNQLVIDALMTVHGAEYTRVATKQARS